MRHICYICIKYWKSHLVQFSLAWTVCNSWGFGNYFSSLCQIIYTRGVSIFAILIETITIVIKLQNNPISAKCQMRKLTVVTAVDIEDSLSFCFGWNWVRSQNIQIISIKLYHMKSVWCNISQNHFEMLLQMWNCSILWARHKSLFMGPQSSYPICYSMLVWVYCNM